MFPRFSGVAPDSALPRCSRTEPAIQASRLRKEFPNGRDAVQHLDLTVSRGSVFGLLGPNGAGKSTALRMLAGLLTPSHGELRVVGCDPARQPNSLRYRVGYVPQLGHGTDPLLTVRQELRWQARAFGISRAHAHERARALIERFDLGEYADQRCSSLSGGQRRRVEFALGVVHQPELALLDEPTAGLDPRAREQLSTEVRHLNTNHVTVFLTTHYLAEAATLCDDVAIVDRGRVVVHGSPGTLTAELGGETLVAETTSDSDELGRILREQSFADHVEVVDPYRLRARVHHGHDAVRRTVALCEEVGIVLSGIRTSPPDLDDVFRVHTGQSLQSVDASREVRP